MKPRLLHRDRDFDAGAPLPPQAAALTQDLGLDTLFAAMADGDDFLLETAKQAVLAGQAEDPDGIRYRQAVLQDCLQNRAVVQSLYDIAVEAAESRRRRWYGILGRYPGSILYGALELLQMQLELLRRLRQVAEAHGGAFASEGFRALFATFRSELTEDYLGLVAGHLAELRFKHGVLVSASLGEGNEGADYVLRRDPAAGRTPSWVRRLLGRRRSALTIRIDPRDEAGGRALGELRDRGINLAANALAQSADHIQAFFVLLRSELGFHLGCANLQRRLAERNCPCRFPDPFPAGDPAFRCEGLRDPCLVLNLGGNVVGNDVEGAGKRLVLVTGANQGGKSTFLRSVGLAHLMMQSGMFVAAEAFAASVCRGVFTHFKREEDAAMESGKFDEELRRMSGIVDSLTAEALLLCNESFASTYEREGSEIARQIVGALREARVKVVYVTHLYDLARGFWEEGRADTLFLRADRETDGRRTFRLNPGEPLETAYGGDLYRQVFGDGRLAAGPPPEPAAAFDAPRA